MVVLINVPAPQEGILHTEENTILKCRLHNFGTGTFYITQRSIYWINHDGKGFSVPYESVSAFAISRKQSEEMSDDCLYVVVSGPDEGDEEEEAAEDVDIMLTQDFQVIPNNADSLRLLYEIILNAQRNLPVDDDDDNDDDDVEENGEENDDGNYEDAEDEQNGFNGVINYVDILGGGDNADIGPNPEEDMNGNEEDMDVEQFEDASSEN